MVLQNGAMIRILLCDQLGKVIGTNCYEAVLSGQTTVKMALSGLLRQYPGLRSYILDDTGVLRRRVALFVDSVLVNDPIRLSDVLRPTCTLHIMRSLGPRAGMCWSTDWRERRLSACRPFNNKRTLQSPPESPIMAGVAHTNTRRNEE